MLIRHPVSARGNDLYETPEVATLALLRAEPLPRTIWEPACGPGAIVRVLRDAGHRVIATDLIDYRSPDQDHAGRDFLLERRAPDGVEMIVTNPPFKLAAQFAAHALSLCPRVAMLLRLSFLESGNEKTKAGRARLFALDGGHLARVLVFSKPPADDAPRRLGRKSRFKSDGVRLVRLGARLYRQARN